MFDHKAVHLSFNPPPKVIRPPTISRAILNDPDIDLVVKISIFETYAIHSIMPSDDARHNMLNSLGTARNNLKTAGPDSSILPPGTRSDHEELVRSGILAEIKESLDNIPIHELALGNLIEGVG
jgi:hypothetical protein